MKNILLLFTVLFICICTYASEINNWKTYLSYTTTTNVEESASTVFVIAEGSLYTYGKEDNSIKTYYKGNGLNDNTISLIRYNKQTESLLIIYNNSNIDLFKDGVCKNIPYLYSNTSLTNKTINSVFIHKEYAYLNTAFGIVVLNMNKNEITETYNLGKNITSSAILNEYIYASVKDLSTGNTSVLKASLSTNLLDKSNWNTHSINSFSDESILELAVFKDQLIYLIKNKGVYYETDNSLKQLYGNQVVNFIKAIDNKLVCIGNSQFAIFSDLNTSDIIRNISIKDISTYQTDRYWLAESTKGLRSIKKVANNTFEPTSNYITIDGPYYNSPYKMVYQNNKLFVIPGGKRLSDGEGLGLHGNIMIFDTDKWTNINRQSVYDKLKFYPNNYTSILINNLPSGEESVFVSAFGNGLIQYINNEPVIRYNNTNSPIQTAVANNNEYCRIDGLRFDKKGNIWMTNSQVSEAIKIIDTEGNWHSLSVNHLNGLYTINDILITSNNDKWINVPRPTSQKRIVVIPESNSLDEASAIKFESFTDTQGYNFAPSSFTCMAEDRKGYIWIGTNKGVIYFTNPQHATIDEGTSLRCTRVILTNEDDDTPYYFLDNVMVTTIKVDQGNRKWIGTQSNGVYVLDNTNQSVIHQFSESNSPLLSDNIYSIEINDDSGEVFIGTDKGIISYKGEATKGKEAFSEVYAYPNPVRPEHADKVTITGLMDNSKVKITDLAGNLIYQTESIGGQVIWNCKNKNNRRVATGIYLVLATDENNSDSVVTKIAVIK